MPLSTLLFCHVLYGIVCAILARKRNRSKLQWFALALPFGVLALFVLLLLPALPHTVLSADASVTERRA
ncbi:MAG: hypothetical protein AB1640_21260 [bacterium]